MIGAICCLVILVLEFFSIYRLYTAYYAVAASLFSHANLISFLDQGEDHQKPFREAFGMLLQASSLFVFICGSLKC